jgi:hypothetical protein
MYRNRMACRAFDGLVRRVACPSPQPLTHPAIDPGSPQPGSSFIAPPRQLSKSIDQCEPARPSRLAQASKLSNMVAKDAPRGRGRQEVWASLCGRLATQSWK